MLNEFKSFLATLNGVTISKEENNILSFKYKDLNLLFVLDDDDPYYIRIILPNIATASNIKDDYNINEVINNCNTYFKVAKMIIRDNSIWLSIEQFLYSKEKSGDFFKRSLSIVDAVIGKLSDEYLK